MKTRVRLLKYSRKARYLAVITRFGARAVNGGGGAVARDDAGPVPSSYDTTRLGGAVARDEAVHGRSRFFLFALDLRHCDSRRCDREG